MKSIQLKLMLILLLISAVSFQSYSQTIVNKHRQVITSANSEIRQFANSLSFEEFKQIAKYLNELEYLRNENAILKDQKSILMNDVTDCRMLDNYRKQQIENLQQTIEEVRPAWYDNFWFGAAASAIVVSGFYLLSK